MKLRLSLKTQEMLAEADETSLEGWQVLHRREFELDASGFDGDAWVPMHIGEIEEELLPQDCLYGKQQATHRRTYSLDEARALGIRWDDSDPGEDRDPRFNRGGRTG